MIGLRLKKTSQKSYRNLENQQFISSHLVGIRELIFNAVSRKCNLTELHVTTKNACVPVVVSSVLICACTRIPCAP